jgi:thiamine biosynthesis lipoprotein
MEDRFPSMGGFAHVIVNGDAELIGIARARLAELEARWTRFTDDSELAKLNAAHGGPVIVSPETAAVIALAIDAWWRTGGRFDPTMLEELLAAGYDRTFSEVRSSRVVAPMRSLPFRDTSCADVWVDLDASMVAVPAGIALDLGGIGKGRAADVVALELLDAGARGAAIAVGGDLRVAGVPEDAEAWTVGIDLPLGGALTDVVLREGGVATSTRARRQWQTTEGVAHHLLDPATRRPADNGVVQVTVVAGDAAWAEVYAKAAFLAGLDEGPALLESAGMAGLFVDEDGELYRTTTFERFER